MLHFCVALKKIMANQTTNHVTTLDAEEVIVRAVQFFSTEKWKVTSQSKRSVTLEGKVPVPWFMLLLMIIGFMVCILPGIVLYILVYKKMNRFFHIIVSVTPASEGTEVCVQHPKEANKLALEFIEALPSKNE